VNENLYRRFEPAEITEIRARLVHSAQTASVFRIENAANDPARLDRAADRALQFGLRKVSEMLAHRAQAMREAQP